MNHKFSFHFAISIWLSIVKYFYLFSSVSRASARSRFTGSLLRNCSISSGKRDKTSRLSFNTRLQESSFSVSTQWPTRGCWILQPALCVSHCSLMYRKDEKLYLNLRFRSSTIPFRLASTSKDEIIISFVDSYVTISGKNRN